MASTVTFNINGLAPVIEKLQRVSYDVKKKGGRSALRKAARQVVNNIKANAAQFDDPETTRSIAKNVNLRWNSWRFNKTGDLAFKIGILGGAKKDKILKARKRKKGTLSLAPITKNKALPGGDTWYWRMIEFGTEKQAARPFVRPALADHVEQITDIFVEAYDKALDKALQQGGGS